MACYLSDRHAETTCAFGRLVALRANWVDTTLQGLVSPQRQDRILKLFDLGEGFGSLQRVRLGTSFHAESLAWELSPVDRTLLSLTSGLVPADACPTQ